MKKIIIYLIIIKPRTYQWDIKKIIKNKKYLLLLCKI